MASFYILKRNLQSKPFRVFSKEIVYWETFFVGHNDKALENFKSHYEQAIFLSVLLSPGVSPLSH